jgi:hypothetical protein
LLHTPFPLTSKSLPTPVRQAQLPISNDLVNRFENFELPPSSQHSEEEYTEARVIHRGCLAHRVQSEKYRRTLHKHSLAQLIRHVSRGRGG